MAKRKTHNSDDRPFDAEDNPIGLTGAFEVIRDPQAVEYDKDDDSIGLTEAFGAVSTGQDAVHSWDEAGKWADFDWNEAPGSDGLDGEPEAGGPEGGSGAASEEPCAEGPDAAGPIPENEGGGGGATPAGDGPSAPAASPAAAAPPPASRPASPKRGKHGRHAAPEPELSPRMKKSKRTRKVLIVIVVLLVLAVGALCYFMYKTFSESQEEAAQTAQQQVEAPKDDMGDTSGDDTVETAAKLTDVPNLTALLGKTTDEAIAELGRGALVTQNRKVDEKGNKVKTSINVALTEEPADSKTGTPTVYLGLNKKGAIVQVGYSASASALGFGSLSFADAVMVEHVVEKTLAKVGVEVPEGAAQLPKDKKKYSTYASDGTTVVKERCSFDGDTNVGGKDCEWSAVLSYDYTTQVVTGNLSDTVRIIYVYITEK